MNEKRWRGKKRWPCHNKTEPIRALLGIESTLDSCHQKGKPPTDRQISVMLGLCRSALETLCHQGVQQKTIIAFTKGTQRPKK